MITISFIHGRKGANKLELKVHFKEERKSRYYTFERIPPEFWDSDNKTLKPTHPNFTEVFQKMNTLITLANSLWDDMNKFGTPSSVKLMQRIKSRFEFKEIEEVFTISEYAKKWLAEADISERTRASYAKSVKILSEFSSDMSFDDFGYEYSTKLLSKLKKDYSNKNTLKKHWITFSIIFRNAYNNRFLRDKDFAAFSNIKVTGQSSNREFLYPKDFKELMDKDFEDETLNLIRDAFTLSFFTSLRKSDILSITNENISLERSGDIILTITPKKTDEYKREATYNLTKLFNGDPEKLMFKYMKGEEYFTKLTNNSVFTGLKKISGIMGWKDIKFHSARHSSLTYVAKTTKSVFEVMNHGCISNVSTAEKYIHVNDKMFNAKLIEW